MREPQQHTSLVAKRGSTCWCFQFNKLGIQTQLTQTKITNFIFFQENSRKILSGPSKCTYCSCQKTANIVQLLGGGVEEAGTWLFGTILGWMTARKPFWHYNQLISLYYAAGGWFNPTGLAGCVLETYRWSFLLNFGFLDIFEIITKWCSFLMYW